MTATARVRRNVIANFAGKVGTALLNILFVPVWMRQMGVESYGLVGAFSSLVVILSVFDLGLSTTLNRELAIRSSDVQQARDSRDLVRTFEIVFWSVGLVAGGAIVIFGPAFADRWLHAEKLSPGTISRAVVLMGIVVVFQWPATLYSAGLQGLQRHVSLNIITVIGSLLRTCGGATVLWLIAPTIQVFFAWQALVSAIQTLLMAHQLWSGLPTPGCRAIFRLQALINCWRFAGGVASITLLVAVLTQVDRLILSRFVSLELFGYYSFAATVAIGLNALVLPISSALFPRLTQLAGSPDQTELVRVYHFTCQLVALFVIPMSICVALFAGDLLSFWLRDPITVKQTALLVSLLTVGTALNSIMAIPYNLQLANGWTALSVYVNLVALFVIPAAMVFFVEQWGPAGAASGWILLNLGYVLFEIPIMHRRLLRNQMWYWYAIDVALPAGLALTLAVLGFLTLLEIGFLWIVTVIIVSVTLPALREWLLTTARSRLPSGVSRSLRIGL